MLSRLLLLFCLAATAAVGRADSLDDLLACHNEAVGGPAALEAIREGEIYLLPANVPHSPQRPAGTIGLVIEQKRPDGVKDRLQWYAEDTHDLLWEAEFTLQNIERDLSRILDTFWSDEKQRRNQKTG